jgi:hypothetical protein
VSLSGKGRRTKGAVFERLVAGLMRRIFPSAERNIAQTRSAKREGGDVLNCGLFHVECKHGVATVYSAMRQAEADCRVGRVPIVVSKPNGGRSVYVTMLFDDFEALVTETSRVCE